MKSKLETDCPIAEMAILLSDAWTMLIIRDLLEASLRFSDLERSLKGISSRTLTNKIKRLEKENIITKNGLYYSITKQGMKLEKIIKAMSDCGERFSKAT